MTFYGKLVDGCIPAGTDCPWKEECGMIEICKHQGTKHTVPFSCAVARSFEMIEEIEARKNAK